jgi:hypothetical protein
MPVAEGIRQQTEREKMNEKQLSMMGLAVLLFALAAVAVGTAVDVVAWRDIRYRTSVIDGLSIEMETRTMCRVERGERSVHKGRLLYLPTTISIVEPGELKRALAESPYMIGEVSGVSCWMEQRGVFAWKKSSDEVRQ